MGANGTTVKVVAAILIATMIGTTFLTSRQMILKTGWAEDPQQRMVQRLMLYGVPFSLLISGALFPLGVVLYWVTQNLFSLGQQMWVLRKYPPPNQSGTGPSRRRSPMPRAATRTALRPRRSTPRWLRRSARSRSTRKRVVRPSGRWVDATGADHTARHFGAVWSATRRSPLAASAHTDVM
jgi:YidC/Oxa1 family membrane protein insertase